VFGLTAIVYAALVPAAYYLILESGYFKRDAYENTDKKSVDWDEDNCTLNLDIPAAAVEIPPKKTYSQQLAIFNGRFTNKAFWKGVIKPLGLLASPIVLYSAVLNSLILMLVAGGSTLATIILAAPPYNLTPSQIGLTNLPLFGVAIVGGPVAGWLSDRSVRLLARTNGAHQGVAEPEFRLALLFVAMPLAAVGLVGLGASVARGQPLPWVLTWLSAVTLGSTAGVQVSIAYLIDCMPEHSAHAFSSVNAAAALAVFAGIAPLIGVLDARGPQVVFGGLAAASFAVTVLAVPMWVFGKRIRGWLGRAAWAQALLR